MTSDGQCVILIKTILLRKEPILNTMKHLKTFSLLLAVLFLLSACSYSTVIQKPEEFPSEDSHRTERIILNFSVKQIDPGEHFSLIAAIAPIPAYAPQFDFVSNDPDVAAVDAIGTVSGVSEGSTKIIVSSGDLIAECVVTVGNTPVTPTVTVSPTPTPFPTETPTTSDELIMIEGIEIIGSTTCFVGHQSQYTIKLTPENANEPYTIHNSNDRCASIDNNALLTCTGIGTTTITVETEDGRISESLQVHINDYVEDIDIVADSFTVYEGQSITLTAVTTPEGTEELDVYWVNEKNHAQNGGKILVKKTNGTRECTITGVSAGRVMVTVGLLDNFYSGLTSTVWITIIPDPTPKIEISEDTYTVNAGEALKLPVNSKNIEGDLIYTISEEGIIEIDGEGNITAIKAGTVTVTVKNNDESAFDSAVITVVPVIKSDTRELSVAVGQAEKIVATLVGAEGTLKYTLTEGDAITLSENGNFTADKEGETTVTVSCEELKLSITVKVIVINANSKPTPEPGPEE